MVRIGTNSGYTHTVNILLSDQNVEETAIAAYWVTDGINQCRVGFLPQHCIRQANNFDGHFVQVVALLAHSENASERRHSRNNRGVCYGGIIDSKVTKVVTTWNNREQQATEINALAASMLAEGSERDDKDDDEEFPDSNEQRTGG